MFLDMASARHKKLVPSSDFWQATGFGHSLICFSCSLPPHSRFGTGFRNSNRCPSLPLVLASDASNLKVNSAVERMVAANIVVVVAAGNEAERGGFGVQG